MHLNIFARSHKSGVTTPRRLAHPVHLTPCTSWHSLCPHALADSLESLHAPFAHFPWPRTHSHILVHSSHTTASYHTLCTVLHTLLHMLAHSLTVCTPFAHSHALSSPQMASQILTHPPMLSQVLAHLPTSSHTFACPCMALHVLTHPCSPLNALGIHHHTLAQPQMYSQALTRPCIASHALSVSMALLPMLICSRYLDIHLYDLKWPCVSSHTPACPCTSSPAISSPTCPHTLLNILTHSHALA